MPDILTAISMETVKNQESQIQNEECILIAPVQMHYSLSSVCLYSFFKSISMSMSVSLIYCMNCMNSIKKNSIKNIFSVNDDDSDFR